MQSALFSETPIVSDAGLPTSVPGSVVQTPGSVVKMPGGPSVPLNSVASSSNITPELVALIAQSVQDGYGGREASRTSCSFASGANASFKCGVGVVAVVHVNTTGERKFNFIGNAKERPKIDYRTRISLEKKEYPNVLNSAYRLVVATADNVIADEVHKNEKIEESEADKQKKMDVLIIQEKSSGSQKRPAKMKLTKLRHELERLCVKNS
ncbi:hypothetical protein OS493_004848 [Desmophyllum pertusum]|uniref:Uncharacterized protein n=1 Tax=Desmophyllum pertusum TaxID=174260 RepID=A0A9W9Z3V9_9CNID|nr:hypothetical protein OS493_004848 [Desmophyllum pertusum]